MKTKQEYIYINITPTMKNFLGKENGDYFVEGELGCSTLPEELLARGIIEKVK